MPSFVLKILAIFFMVIDHVGYVLFPNIIALRIIGRLSFPLFAYQMAVGFSHTRNEKKHIVKLLLFAIICQFPYSYMIGDNSVLNILFTFVIALLIILLINQNQIYLLLCRVKLINNKKMYLCLLQEPKFFIQVLE